MNIRGIVIGALLAASVILPGVYARERAALRSFGLTKDSLEAVRDTTRRVTLALGVLAEGTALVQRRVVQTEQRADSLDRALRLERKARAEVVGQSDSLMVERVISATPLNSHGLPADDTLRFGFYREPYRVGVKVALRPLPPQLAVAIQQDPVPMGFRLQCGPRNEFGVRSALLSATAPDWFRLDLRSLEQTPDLCNPKPGKSWFHDWRTWTLLGALGLAVAR